MEEKAVDRRVRKTRRLLRQGLTQLMREKRVQDITVRELSDLCDINRGTFYLHYRDVFDMVEQVEEEIFFELCQVLNQVCPDNMPQNPRPILIQFFRFLQENADMAQVLTGPNGDMAFVQRLTGLVREKCRLIWPSICAPGGADMVDFRSSYIASGCVGLVESWLAGGAAVSSDKMAALCEGLIVYSMRATGA